MSKKKEKMFLEKARKAFVSDTRIDREEARKLAVETRILDDSDEEVEKEDEKNKAEWAEIVGLNKRQDAENLRESREVVNDIFFREDQKGKVEKVRMEPFNMKNERAEGYFDEFSMYHENKEDDSDDDFQRLLHEDQHQLETLQDKKILEKHKEKWEKEHTAFAEEKDAPKNLEDLEKEVGEMLSLYNPMYHILQDKETISQAMVRIGKASKKRKKFQQDGPRKKRKKKRAWEVDSDEEQDQEELTDEQREAMKKQLNLLTDATSRISSLGEYGIYDINRSEVFRRLAVLNQRRAAIKKEKEAVASGAKPTFGPQRAPQSTADAFNADAGSESSEDESSSEEEELESKPDIVDQPPKANSGQWEYMWEQQITEAQKGVHGPFPTEKLKIWHSKGFFKRGIKYRSVGTEKWFSSKTSDISKLE